jgi:hypothetical protein
MNVPPRLRDRGTRVQGDAQGGHVEVPPNFRDFREMGDGGHHIYNIKNIKYKILKIKIIMIKSQQ